ncbi:rod shape-determining protein MreC [Calditrichota bacterium GD2]
MNIFSSFFIRNKEGLTLFFYLLLSFLFMTTSDRALVEGLRRVSVQTIGRIESTVSIFRSYFNLYEKNSELRRQNTLLSFENFQLQEALLENIRLKKFLKISYQFKYKLIPAKVIGYSPHEIVTGFRIIAKGITEKHKGAAVMTVGGLVGRVVETSPPFAICQILLDPTSRVSVRIQRNREVGVVSWDGENGLQLNYIPNTIEVLPGDIIFTSGLSQIYPPNIKVGVVTAIEKNPNEMFQKIRVKPSVNFSALEEVFIVEMEPSVDEARK